MSIMRLFENVDPTIIVGLMEWLKKSGIADSAIDTVFCELIKIGYDAHAISNLYVQLSQHGHLFLNCLMRALKTADVDNIEVLLKPLGDILNRIEFHAMPIAHFIWVGPPTDTGSELIGIKSLTETFPDQKIKFWILDEYVQSYKILFEKENLNNIEIISIEHYAKKIDLKFGEEKNSSLFEEIEFFKSLANKKMAEAIKLPSPNQKPKITDAIRDRVTIVDHIKPLIGLFEGGWVFDVDIIFHDQTRGERKQCLPKLSRWTFPKMYAGMDVWAFYCLRSLSWDGKPDITDADEMIHKMRLKRTYYVQEYNRLAKKIYAERGDLPMEFQFAPSLGEAICGIANTSPATLDGSERYLLGEKLNDYIPLCDELESWVDQDEKNFAKYIPIGRCVMDVWPFSEDMYLVKHFVRSHALGENSYFKNKTANFFASLLCIKAPFIFERTLLSRCQFAGLNVLDTFSISVVNKCEIIAANMREIVQSDKILLNGITILHLSLLIRPDLFEYILNYNGNIEELKNILEKQKNVLA